MEKIYTGKTKDIFKAEDGNIILKFKDDARQDPIITKDGLVALNILTAEDYEKLQLLQKICNIVKDVLAEKGVTLYDIKLEFGKIDNKVVLIDEISGGNMRAYDGEKIIHPTEIYSYLK